MQNYNKNKDINECTSRGSCSTSPTIFSLEILAITFLQKLSYYLLKLENLGAKNQKIRNSVIKVLSSLVSINEFSEEQVYSLIQVEYYMFEESKKIYAKLNQDKGLKIDKIKSPFNFSTSTTLAEAIVIGEKIYFDNIKKYDSEIRNLKEIYLISLKNLAITLAQILDFEELNEKEYNQILSALNLLNTNNITNTQILNNIYNLAQYNKLLQLKLNDILLKNYNGIDLVNVSYSSNPGKAILVSGNNLSDLQKILQFTKDKNIDVYTHSNLLIAHAFNTFKEYPHLKGHYGSSGEICILDFATFPGSILLTKNSHGGNEYLYRGRLFTNDYIVPKGVIKISNDNYTPVLESAKLAKGFSKGKIKEDKLLGYNIEELKKVFINIKKNIESKKIEKLYIVGLDAHSEIQTEYFKEFYSKLKHNEFVISFSYYSTKDNVYTINLANSHPLVFGVLKLLFEYIKIDNPNIYFLFTTCDVVSLSALISLNLAGAKNIWLSKCSPTIVNPSILKTIAKKYNLKFLTSPMNDLSQFRQK